MANSIYGTIASPGKSDFDRFMEDMNRIGGYDSNTRESTSNLITIDTKPDKPTGAGTTATANQGTVTNYGSTPNYDRQDALLDRKERIAVGNRNLEWGREDFDNAIQRGREDRARGDMLDAQRYNQLQDRNDRFSFTSSFRTAGDRDARIARQEQNMRDMEDKRRWNEQFNLERQQYANDQISNLRQREREDDYINKEFAIKNREIDALENKYKAEIATLNNTNNWRILDTMAEMYNAEQDRQYALTAQREGNRNKLWGYVSDIYS